MTQKSAKVHNKKKSLCEKSMILVANIIKLSSFSFLSSTTNPVISSAKAADHDDGLKELLVAAERSRSSGGHRSREPESGSERRRSYLMNPPQEDHRPPSYVITQEKKELSTVDDMANDFIQRKREKINETSDYSNPAPKRFSRKLPPKIKDVKFSS